MAPMHSAWTAVTRMDTGTGRGMGQSVQAKQGAWTDAWTAVTRMGTGIQPFRLSNLSIFISQWEIKDKGHI